MTRKILFIHTDKHIPINLNLFNDIISLIMDEVYKNQESIISSFQEENAKHLDIQEHLDMEKLLFKARSYHTKLTTIKRDIMNIDDRISKLKRRAVQLIEMKSKAEQDRRRSEERREILERHLQPVVNTSRN